MTTTNVSFMTRSGWPVAEAIYQEMEGRLPTFDDILSFDQRLNESVFRFIGGLVVRLHMVDHSSYSDSASDLETWSTYRAQVRFYGSNRNEPKLNQTWEYPLLTKLLEKWGKRTDWACDPEQVTAYLILFEDKLTGDQMVSEPPHVLQGPGYPIVGYVDYHPLVPGDKARSLNKAYCVLANLEELNN